MQVRDQTNVFVKAVLKEREFRKSKNQHKFAILWASKLYQSINHVMRDYDSDKVIKDFPYTTSFIVQFLKILRTTRVVRPRNRIENLVSWR